MRILQRLLALTAAIWHNHHSQPTRPPIAHRLRPLTTPWTFPSRGLCGRGGSNGSGRSTGRPLRFGERPDPQPERPASSSSVSPCAASAGPTCTWPRATSRRADHGRPRARGCRDNRAPRSRNVALRDRPAGGHRVAAQDVWDLSVLPAAATRTCVPRPAFTGWDADGGYAELAVVHEDYAYQRA